MIGTFQCRFVLNTSVNSILVKRITKSGDKITQIGSGIVKMWTAQANGLGFWAIL